MRLPHTDSTLAAQAALTGVAIPAPLLLPSTQRGSDAVLHCTAALATGALEISSASSGSGRVVHVQATAAAVHQHARPPTTSASGGGRAYALLPGKAAGAGSAAAVGVLQSDTGRTGLWLDPAPFDCFLQLGQVFMAPGSAEVYVPAGLGALRAAPAAAQLAEPGSGSSWAATVPLPAAVPAAVSSDFQLSGGAGPLCSILALEAKSMGRAAVGIAAGKAAPAAVQHIECLYEVAWQVAGEAGAGAALPGGAQSLWRLAARQGQEPAQAAASALAAVQSMLASAPTGAGVQLQALGCGAAPALPGRPAGSLEAAAALTGMIKTLGQEAPQLGWSSRHADELAPGAGAHAAARLVQLPPDALGADAFGSAARSGLRLEPTLLRSGAQEALGPHHLFPMPRGSLTSLAPLPVDLDRKLKADEVLLAVRAVGINFRWGPGDGVLVHARQLGWHSAGPWQCKLKCLPATALPFWPPPVGTCSMCWACTLATPARLAATAPAWCCAAT